LQHTIHPSLLFPALPLLDPRPNAIRPTRLCLHPIRRRTRRIFNLVHLLLHLDLLLDQLFPLLNLFIRRRILTAIVIRILVHHEPIRNPADEEPPEEVDRLQRCQKRKGNVLRDPALVLLSFPVEFKRSDSLERGEDGVDDLEVDVMASVTPDDHEDEKVRTDNGRVDVVEAFGRLDHVSNVLFPRTAAGKKTLTARKKSDTSCVMYTAIPMYVKWNL
jgi:hypothetical protein